MRFVKAGCSLLGLALLSNGCWTPPQKRFPEASEQGRRACIEEVQANYAPQGRVEAMRRCLQSIDQRLKAVKELDRELRDANKPAPQPVSAPSASERLVYCRLHQQEIQEAERRRQRAQSIWLRASSSGTQGNADFETARAEYQEALDTLDRMIPEEFRAGLSLVPEAIMAYSACTGSIFSP